MNADDMEVTQAEDEYEVKKPDHAAYVQKSLDESGEAAEWEVVVASAQQLMLDFDAPQVPEQFYKLMAMDFVREAIGNDYHVYTSRSGNKHVVVNLDSPALMLERIAWQGILGSDPKRESLHIRSYRDHSLNPILLVMRKDRGKPSTAVDELGDRKLKTVKEPHFVGLAD